MNNVKVKERKGYIVFSLSSKVAWQYYKKKQKDISYGAKFNSHEDLAQAYQMATILERDIEQGTFDSHNIGKYQKKSPLVKAESNFECLSLLELFDKYVEDNSNLSVTGKLQHQTKFRKPLEECPSNITIVENQYQT